MNEFKDTIDKFNNNIDNIIKLLQNVKKIMEKYYAINNSILNNYNLRNRNYEIFSNLNNINSINNNQLIKDLRDIIIGTDLSSKFNKIYNLYNRIKNN